MCGKTKTYNNWAKGYYTVGGEVLEEALKIVRTEVEACDSVQGWKFNSLGEEFDIA